MNKDEIVGYINSNLKRGLNIEEIRQQLLSRNFSDYDINEAIPKSNYKEVSKNEDDKKEDETKHSMEGWDSDIPEI